MSVSNSNETYHDGTQIPYRSASGKAFASGSDVYVDRDSKKNINQNIHWPFRPGIPA
ncbi:hypothetical protein POX_c04630 [Penicillium oxalicum]|uniref:hypothetical protein n=1 Tax=Penicillium oxalicum TaxID=69781 RepID=UPI0020B64A60|nr:hypothetical protein POX_c04630 [Penicillium oxalicum]KAI2791752.1 hypothetical protein POX_c04630 [Penicillium oxalicum]